jgi:hypothetical protein
MDFDEHSSYVGFLKFRCIDAADVEKISVMWKVSMSVLI